MPADLLKLLPGVEAALKAAAETEILPRFLKVARQHKADGSTFSEADIAAQAFLSRALGQLLHLPMLGEEMSDSAQREAWQAGDKGLWVMDPIDGTTNFLVGLPQFAVSVALLRGGKPVLGVSYLPMAGEMFSAVAGQGAWLNGEPLPLRPSGNQLSKAVACVDFKRLPAELAAHLVQSSPIYSQRNFGSSVLEWCYLAAGRVDAVLHGGQRLWDHAAGSLLVREAGGCAATFREDDFDQANPWRRQVIAALNPELFCLWRDWLRQHGAR
ncbi:inositol monophosphatase family protein [Azovibrio restrictus]|uniref:inositol monophosphatase family protein n=1 Tax=Azovibrio restrictus TaxID=146938 RepID=UPI0026F21AFD|nr:inositol monophosphatase family protein [Azovibrio restrictus]MDD3481712.1 inositol monophosphatase family protein [Azovibrio restrictus]